MQAEVVREDQRKRIHFMMHRQRAAGAGMVMKT